MPYIELKFLIYARKWFKPLSRRIHAFGVVAELVNLLKIKIIKNEK